MCACVTYCSSCVSRTADRVEAASDDALHPAMLLRRREVVDTLRAIAAAPFDAADMTYITFVRQFCYDARE